MKIRKRKEKVPQDSLSQNLEAQDEKVEEFSNDNDNDDDDDEDEDEEIEYENEFAVDVIQAPEPTGPVTKFAKYMSEKCPGYAGILAHFAAVYFVIILFATITAMITGVLSTFYAISAIGLLLNIYTIYLGWPYYKASIAAQKKRKFEERQERLNEIMRNNVITSRKNHTDDADADKKSDAKSKEKSNAKKAKPNATPDTDTDTEATGTES